MAFALALVAMQPAAFLMPTMPSSTPYRLVPPSMSESAAKAAWLARLDAPWSRGEAVSTAAAQAPPVATSDYDGRWLAPGAPVLTLEAADQMANEALREASICGFNPISVVVMDAGGRVIISKTMISCAKLAPDFAQAKAAACIGQHCSSRELRDKYVNDQGTGPKMPQLVAMGIVGAAANHAIAPFPGGVLCRDTAGNVICAMAVSGAASDEDEHCAIVAAQSVGLVTEPAVSQLV
jgi:uncharacterized protein GlcG (DUF336 family)